MLKPGNEELRKVYVATLMDLAEKDKDVVVLEADLSSSIGTTKFKEKFPGQFVNCGIMEAEMIGAAAGMSLMGKRPYVHTFASFATRRVFDQVFLSLAYTGLQAVILGSDAGIAAEFNGGTHMPLEDVGVMRNLYNCMIAEPSDEHMMKALIEMTYEKGGLWYIRTSRKKLPQIYNEHTKFEPGKAKVVKDGKDACIMTYGICVADAVLAAETLMEKGMDVAVVDMFTINPLDKEIVRHYIGSCGKIITVENHSITNGLGSAVAEVIAESGKGVKFNRLGIANRYGQTGSLDFLKKDYGIDAGSIARAVENIL